MYFPVIQEAHNRLKDFSNPEIAKHLHFYPEDVGDCAISEVWQADRWKEFRSDELTPMFARGAKRFFVDEVCQLDDDSYVIPRLWVMRQGVLCADCSNVDVTPVSHLIISQSLQYLLTNPIAWMDDLGRYPERQVQAFHLQLRQCCESCRKCSNLGKRYDYITCSCAQAHTILQTQMPQICQIPCVS